MFSQISSTASYSLRGLILFSLFFGGVENRGRFKWFAVKCGILSLHLCNFYLSYFVLQGIDPFLQLCCSGLRVV